MKKEICGTFHAKMRDAGFDVSFRDCPAKGGTGGQPSLTWDGCDWIF
jgi:hypothetical protein